MESSRGWRSDVPGAAWGGARSRSLNCSVRETFRPTRPGRTEVYRSHVLAEESDARPHPHRTRRAQEAQRPGGAVGKVRPLRFGAVPARARGEPPGLTEVPPPP